MGYKSTQEIDEHFQPLIAKMEALLCTLAPPVMCSQIHQSVKEHWCDDQSLQCLKWDSEEVWDPKFMDGCKEQQQECRTQQQQLREKCAQQLRLCGEGRG